jgi:chromosome segregation ATPase
MLVNTIFVSSGNIADLDRLKDQKRTADGNVRSLEKERETIDRQIDQLQRRRDTLDANIRAEQDLVHRLDETIHNAEETFTKVCIYGSFTSDA